MWAGNPLLGVFCPPPLWGSPLAERTFGGKLLIDTPFGGRPLGGAPFGERGIVPLYIDPFQGTLEAAENAGPANG